MICLLSHRGYAVLRAVLMTFTRDLGRLLKPAMSLWWQTLLCQPHHRVERIPPSWGWTCYWVESLAQKECGQVEHWENWFGVQNLQHQWEQKWVEVLISGHVPVKHLGTSSWPGGTHLVCSNHQDHHTMKPILEHQYLMWLLSIWPTVHLE